MFAVNIEDLTTDKTLAQFLFAPVLGSRQIVNAEKGMVDGSAVVLDCDDERAKGMIWLVRRKYSKNLFRIYESKNGKTWKRTD